MAGTVTHLFLDSLNKATSITAVTTEPEPNIDRIDLRVAGRALSTPEMDACRKSRKRSIHSSIQVLPKHALDNRGRLQGFCFECSDDDKASILPLHEHCFEMTAVYEVQRDSQEFDPQALHIIANLADSRK